MSNLVGTGGLVWLTVDERGGATEACLGGWGRVEEVVGGAVWANETQISSSPGPGGLPGSPGTKWVGSENPPSIVVLVLGS